MTLREVLHAHIPWLTPESTVRDAVDKMDLYQFPALVVVNEEMNVLAVLTEGDLCRAVAQRESLVSMSDDPAIVYATKQPITAHPDLEIGDAFHLMLGSGLTLLPVVDEGTLAGVVLRMDLMSAMLMDRASAC
jgi:CBS domain-containing protein